MTRLYYEAHITVRPPMFGTINWTWFSSFAERNQFKASRFDVDEVDQYDGCWFLSARDTNLQALKEKIKIANHSLIDSSFKPVRWKIEDTLLDSKYGDTL